MGMFDSFMVEYRGKDHEIQTKKFANTLSVWRIGSIVNEPTIGVTVMFDEIRYNEQEERLDYILHNKKTPPTAVLFIVLANGMYIHSEVREGLHNGSELDNERTMQAIVELKKDWSDTNKQIIKMVSVINKHEQTITHLKRSMYNVYEYIGYARKKFEDATSVQDTLGVFDMHYPELKNINNHKNLVDVVYDIANEAIDLTKCEYTDIEMNEPDMLCGFRL